MKRVTELSSMRAGSPDDLFLTCGGFEDRCLGVAAAGSAYRPRAAALIRFIPGRRQRALDVKRTANTALLLEYLRSHADRVFEVSSARYNPLELELSLEDALASMLPEARRVTVDISCFTRIQLMFVLRLLLQTPGRSVRLIYATPSYYASLDRRDIAVGFDGLLLMPFVRGEHRAPPTTTRNFMIAGLGHEGARCLIAWRTLEPSRTVLVLPHNARSLDLTRITEKQNEELIEHVAAGDPAFSLQRYEPLDISGASAGLALVLDDFDLRDPNALIELVPGGPKPIVAAFAIAAVAVGVHCYVAYPLVSGYDPAYSTGIGSMFEFTVHSPISSVKAGRANAATLS